MAASRALAASCPALSEHGTDLLPPLADLPAVSVDIALAVARQAQTEGVAAPGSEEDLRYEIERSRWHPIYPRIEPVDERGLS